MIEWWEDYDFACARCDKVIVRTKNHSRWTRRERSRVVDDAPLCLRTSMDNELVVRRQSSWRSLPQRRESGRDVKFKLEVVEEKEKKEREEGKKEAAGHNPWGTGSREYEYDSCSKFVQRWAHVTLLIDSLSVNVYNNLFFLLKLTTGHQYCKIYKS